MAFDPTGEEWRPVVGYEGLYEVSSLGRVRRMLKRGRAPKTLVPVLRGGRYRVSLCREGVSTQAKIAHLVAAAFHGPRPDGFDVAHNDGDALNDSASNLRYATRRENIRDKYEHGTMGLKLDPDKVRAIRSAGSVMRHRDVAREFGISQVMVSRIVRRASWGCVE